MANLFYLEEHTSCQRYKSDFQTGFTYSELKAGDTLEAIDGSYNHLLFLKEGLLRLDCNEFYNRKIRKNECILIPKAAKAFGKALHDSALLVMNFDVLQNICDKVMLSSYRSMQGELTWHFTPTPVRYPLTSFVELLITYLKGGIDCEHLHEIKEKELFLVLRRCYSREEIINLLYPIIGISDFKSFVLQNYLEVESVSELADLSQMGRTAFDIKFRDVFGMSARQWMLQQIAKHIRYKAMDPEISIRSIMNEFKFNSATHFYRFCKQQFNCTPGELLKKSREEQENV
ncbi:MAG: AraC family transcriptional regulator [Tannerellaceae bacterium]|jgi:AraC-like DNA-binding protein|nr:AraC family transcriptional regulator [Tannerellaceae bacterium]